MPDADAILATLPEGTLPGMTIGRRGDSGPLRASDAATVRGTRASIRFPGADSTSETLRDGSAPPPSSGAATSGGPSRGRASITVDDPTGASTSTFAVLRTLGQGGMGVVYAAAQESLRREVALKMIRHDASQRREMEGRFVEEALVTARLDHPNVVSVYDLGRDPSGDLYIAMKLVRGVAWQSLVDPRAGDGEDVRARAKAMGLRDHLEIFLKVCDAVSFAHSRDVIHRDLKPDNVMVGAFGEVLVMDWGLALDVSPAARAAMAKLPNEPPCGTPCYMPPELVTGDIVAQGPAVDVYLLGGIAYRLITGTPPHAGGTVAAAITSALSGRMDPATERAKAHGRTAPAALSEVCAKALASKPQDRYASVAELAAAVRGFLSNEGAARLSAAALEELDQIERRVALAGAARRGDRAGRASARAGESGEVPVTEEPHGAQGTYAALAAVSAELTQSLKLWEGNAEAQAGLLRVRLATARYALERGDLGVAEAHLALVAEGAPGRDEIARGIAEERALRERVRVRRRIVLVLVGAFALGGLIAAIWAVDLASVAEAAKARRAEAVRLVEGYYWEDSGQRIEAYERAIKIDPTWAEGHTEAAWALMGAAYDRGIVAPEAGRQMLRFALGHFEEAVRLVPDDQSKLGERAYLHFVRGDVPSAMKDLERTIALDPDSGVGISSRATKAVVEGRLEEAERLLTTSLALRYYGTDCLLRGLVRFALGDLDGAAEDAERYGRDDEADEWGRTFEALILLARGREREAAQKLLEALDTFPRGPHALPLLAAHAARRGDIPRAEALRARALEARREYRDVHGLDDPHWRTPSRSRIPELARWGKALLVEESLASLVPAAPPEALAIRARARERLRTGDAAGAFADASLVLSDDPADGEALLVRARALHALGRSEAAAIELERVDGLAPHMGAEAAALKKELSIALEGK